MRQSFGGQVIPGWTTGNQVADIGLWGDESLWYLLAAANGLSGREALPRGLSLTVPANVINARQTSETFRVYDPNDALGDVHPNQPRANDPQIAQPAPKKNKGCGGAGQILLAVVAIAVAAVVAQWAIPALAKTAIGQAIGGALGAAGSTIGTGVAAGAAGSLVSQGVGVAVGLQDRIDWRGVALSAIAGGVGATPGLSSTSGGFVAQGVRGAAANTLTQGIAIATGLQSKFDWTGVAVGAVVRGTRSAISNVATGDSWSAELVNQATRGVVAGAAGAGVRSLIDGTSFERSFRAALPDIIGSTIGSTIGQAVIGGFQPRAGHARAQSADDLAAAERHANGDYLQEAIGAVTGGSSGPNWSGGFDGALSGIASGGALGSVSATQPWGVTTASLARGDDGGAVTVQEVIVTAPRDRAQRWAFIDNLIDQRVSYSLTYNVNDALAFRNPQLARVRDVAGAGVDLVGVGALGTVVGFGNAMVSAVNSPIDAITYLANNPQGALNAAASGAQRALSYVHRPHQAAADIGLFAARSVFEAGRDYVSDVSQAYQSHGLNGAVFRAGQGVGGVAFLGVEAAVGVSGLRATTAVSGAVAKPLVLDAVEGVAARGLSSSSVVSPARAKAFLVKNGFSPEKARGFIESFEGPITARIVRPGEDFVRYFDEPFSTGNFLGKTRFSSPSEAVDALALRGFPNKATSVQPVTSTGRTIVLEGGIRGGQTGVRQTVIHNQNAFFFGPGVRY